MIEVDAIIIGGGIVGASAALFLSKAGRRVALLERDFCGSHSSGVTTAACAVRADHCRNYHCRNRLTRSGHNCRSCSASTVSTNAAVT